jgi:hypothetical protein
MNTFDPYAEYASEADHSAMMAYRNIAGQTGLALETVAKLGVTNNLGVLFGDDGKLRSSTELRSMEAGGALAVSSGHRRRTIQEKLVDLYEMRWSATQTPSQRLAQLRDMRLDWEATSMQRKLAELEAMRPENRRG